MKQHIGMEFHKASSALALSLRKKETQKILGQLGVLTFISAK